MTKMRMVFASTLTAMVLTVAGGALFGGTAFANPPDGTPGEPNCHGETVAGQAQAHGGLKKAAEDHPLATGGTVQGLQEAVDDFCDDA